MQQYAVYILYYCNITLYVSGAVRTHHQEYIKLWLHPQVLFVQLPHSNVTIFFHVEVRQLHEYMTRTSGCNYSFMYS